MKLGAFSAASGAAKRRKVLRYFILV